MGFSCDPKGDGLMTLRAAYGIFFDVPHLHQYGGKRDTSPKGAQTVVNSPSLDDPWASFPGGNPYPIALDKNSPFPLNGVYTVFPFNMKKPYINQWNLSLQKQFGQNWLVAANYIGNNAIHMLLRYEGNPAVYLPGASCVIAGRTYSPCSSVGNTNQRRVLYLQNPEIGQYFSNIVVGGDGATRIYNALVVQGQRRTGKSHDIQANYNESDYVVEYNC